MLNQSFDSKTLLNLTTKREIINFKLGRNTSEYKDALTEISKKINSENFHFHTLNCYTYEKRCIYKVDSAEEYYAIRKITDNLKRIYKVKFSNKEDIIHQVINIISDTSSFNIIRLDVKNFFESINFTTIIDKIKSDNILSKSSHDKIIQIKKSLPVSFNGLPRGLAISSVLSELFMEEIDNKIRSLSSTYYYARYVDDIILISHDININTDYFREMFSSKELMLNEKSNDLLIAPANNTQETNKFNFLGYDFLIHSKKNQDNFRQITIDMSQNKIKKIKTRIIKAILSHAKSHDEKLLTKRIKFLSGNYIVKNDKNNRRIHTNDDNHNLKGGIYYNNKFINTKSNLSMLNEFLKKLLLCTKNNSIGRAVRSIPISTRRALMSHCFISGHTHVIFHSFTENDIQEIRRCWR
ncbi:antiviral reverse transcriptase Drt3a [Raoultella ornithinolytica]|uniref:antiviral reverse transcriptase Drt3a n=1 Tax=Raoultella ornithinolytica TaxID=54291 RepID=UPI001F210B86|nr:antiviral reverse transcriptase Drt3a [Raoultella ornithinolytica]MCF1301928.1 RNA-directed DNA polymerase [Raoultella ornithinolytica]